MIPGTLCQRFRAAPKPISESPYTSAKSGWRCRAATLLYLLFIVLSVSIAGTTAYLMPGRIAREFTADGYRQNALSRGALIGSAAIASPFLGNGRRRLRIMIYARYSTDEQNPRSIDDQIIKCRDFLKSIEIHDYEEILLDDPGISGRKKSRPGIDHVKLLIAAKDVDLIVAEDLSRLYRKTSFTTELLGLAIDAGVRVMTINDSIDTDDSKWRILSQIQAIHSELYLTDASQRIRRSVDGRWAAGLAVNPLIPGYRRIARNPTAENPKLRGPYRDEKNGSWTPVIIEAFERAARGESLWQICQFFDSCGFPLPRKAESNSWTPILMWRFLQQPLLKGIECHRRTITKSLEVSGESKQVRAEDSQVLERKMPHLAHVPEWLWQKANDAIQSRRRHSRYTRGEDHPTTGIPRDRWGPLSTLLHCGVCGSRMHKDGAYRCAASKARWTRAKKDGQRCSNRCSPRIDIVHAKISKAVVTALLNSISGFEPILSRIQELVREGDGSAEKEIRRLEQEEAALRRKIDKYRKIVDEGSDLSTVVAWLKDSEEGLNRVRLDMNRIRDQKSPDTPLPRLQDIEERAREIESMFLSGMGRDAGALLRQLVDRIDARPYRAFDSNRIVLRAHFSLKLLSLLPDQWRSLLSGQLTPERAGELGSMMTVPLIVDLFEQPVYMQHAAETLRLQRDGLKLSEIMDRLGVRRDIVKAALKAARKMEELGMTDPYALFTEPTLMPGRWKQDDLGTSGSQACAP